MKTFKSIEKQAYFIIILFILSTIIGCILLATSIFSVIRQSVQEKSIEDAEIIEYNAFHQIDEAKSFVDEIHDMVSREQLFSLLTDRYDGVHFSSMTFDDATDRWNTASDDSSVFFYRNHPEGPIVLEIPLAELNHTITTKLNQDFLLLNETGQIVGKETSLDDIDISLIEAADKNGVSFIDFHTIIPSRINGLYMMILDTNKSARVHMKKVVVRAILAWAVIAMLIASYFRYISKRVKNDVEIIAHRVKRIENENFGIEEHNLIFKEFSELDKLLYNMGQVIKDRTDEIHKINSTLESKVEERTKEALEASKRLEKEMHDKEMVEAEIKRLNNSMDTTILERTHELQEANDALNRSAKLAEESNYAKGKFLAVMSHEMRTPLNAIIGFAHMLSMDVEDKEIKETLKLILNASKVLLSLINDVLDYAKYESGKMHFHSEIFNLKSEIMEITETFSVLTENKDLQYQVDGIDLLDHDVIGDPTKIKQVLNNLLNNSLKFTLKGAIDVKFTTVVVDNVLTMDCYIMDTGIGMTDETRDNLFDPFHQGDNINQRQMGGTGLGLSITKEILEHYQGSVVFESELNVGTTCRFNVKLPIIYREDEMESLSYSKILYVEDNVVNQKLMQQYFRKYKIPFDVAFDGKEAIEKFDKGKFDLVFMDLQMPIIDGYEATKHIKQVNPDVYIIAMTAYTHEEVRAKCREVGMDDYMKKPIDFSHLNGLLGLKRNGKVMSHVSQDQMIMEHAETLSRKINFDRAVCKELIMTFVTQLKESLVTIEGLRMDGDYHSIARILHKMKGGAATVRLSKLQHMLTQAEIYAKEEEYKKLFEVVDQMKKVNILQN